MPPEELGESELLLPEESDEPEHGDSIPRRYSWHAYTMASGKGCTCHWNILEHTLRDSANCRLLQVEVLKTQGGQTWQKRINHGVIRTSKDGTSRTQERSHGSTRTDWTDGRSTTVKGTTKPGRHRTRREPGKGNVYISYEICRVSSLSFKTPQ